MKPLVRRTSNLRDLTVPPKMLKLADKVVLKALFSLPLCTAKENTLANNGDQVSHLNRGESKCLNKGSERLNSKDQEIHYILLC